jgi:hypothetical protein
MITAELLLSRACGSSVMMLLTFPKIARRYLVAKIISIAIAANTTIAEITVVRENNL